MRKVTLFAAIIAIALVSCTKQSVEPAQVDTRPIYLKVQAVESDGHVNESIVIMTRPS